MREFNEKDFPPFLDHYEADHTNCVGVETTLAEITSMGYSLAYYDDETETRQFPNAQLLRTHGNRRVFAIINFPQRSVERRAAIFIEVQDDRDAEFLRQSLQDQLNVSVDVEQPDPSYNESPDLDGFRWFRFDV